MGAPWQGQPPVQGKEWGQSQRGRCSHLSCSFPALGSGARASLCFSRTRLAIETGLGTLRTSEGRLEARIRHFTGSETRPRPPAASACPEGPWAVGLRFEQAVVAPGESPLCPLPT